MCVVVLTVYVNRFEAVTYMCFMRVYVKRERGKQNSMKDQKTLLREDDLCNNNQF